MTNAWFVGATQSVPQDENEVRSTVEPIRHSDITDEQESPEWNEFQSDDNGDLVGLAPRVVGSETIESEQSAPFWAPLAGADYEKVIDEQVSSSGTAAAREMSGQFGHGTLQYALGIEPVIREGAAFGEDYFLAHQMGANDQSGAYMTPVDNNNWDHVVAAQQAAANSRAAYQASLYQNFLAATTSWSD